MTSKIELFGTKTGRIGSMRPVFSHRNKVQSSSRSVLGYKNSIHDKVNDENEQKDGRRMERIKQRRMQKGKEKEEEKALQK